MQVAPSGYWRHAPLLRDPGKRCARARRDEALAPQIKRVPDLNQLASTEAGAIQGDAPVEYTGDSGSLRPSVVVHVVATRQKADETILEAATEPRTYVLSNDRFRDFPERPAVRAGRLIRHEVLEGTVIVHDLDVAVRFALPHHRADVGATAK